MGIRKLKPATPGQRHKTIGAFDAITASAPEKSLVVGARKSGGRNNTGKMTIRNVGGGHKRKYRIIDFKRTKDGIPLQSRVSSMIQTDHLASHSYTMPMELRTISSLLTD